MNILRALPLLFVLLVLFAVFIFLLSSCSSSEQEYPEGNIDVDSEIYIVPVGDVDEDLLYPLIDKLEKRFTTTVHVALDKGIPVPEDAYDYDAQQYVAMYVLYELLTKVEVPENDKILGVTNVDLFVPESDRGFIFGQAHVGKNAKGAIISTIRMNPKSYKGGREDKELLISRMTKEAIHELGHVFGLKNCYEKECVMYLPKNRKEIDKKTDSFCLPCQKLSRPSPKDKVVKPPEL
ncbi:hypothetical protein GF312_05810 [Candidatus Poribacteria bacterium]|nr:hypothetical protein [Candidatus Poribacteria bacterium]